MLIRFVTQNIFSFGKTTEFNMLPNTRYKRLPHHKYDVNGFGLLKMTALYGANAAGKSNLIEAISLLQDAVVDEKLSFKFNDFQFKFRSNVFEEQLLAIEFIHKDKSFYYALQIFKNKIQTEELYISGLGKTEDKLIFERNTDTEGKTSIKFLDEFENDEEGKVLKRVIEKNLAKPRQTILKFLTTLENSSLENAKLAFEWFDNSLEIVTPSSYPALAHLVDSDAQFKKYTNDLMGTFGTGIRNIYADILPVEEFAKNNDYDLEELLEALEDSPDKVVIIESDDDDIVLAKDQNGIFVKKLKLEHEDSKGKKVVFDVEEESMGTRRLLDLIPAFHDIVMDSKVFIIDEIEDSIHPLLIKELVRKFSEDINTKGQLIFTTHESNLLDQDIFRQDEIWFAEKDKDGCTDLYSLSDYKEHNTIDIRKGYLMGRYGGIPFLGNLKDLNWHTYDTSETQTV